MEKVISFNTVIILKSIPDYDNDSTSEELLESFKYHSYKNSNIKCFIKEITSKDDLIWVSEYVIYNYKNLGDVPILHFDMHGSKEGLKFKGEANVCSWRELYDYLQVLNKQIDNQLFLTLASCYGGYMFDIIDPLKPSPFKIMIGANSKLNSYYKKGNHIDEANFESFFSVLLDERSIDKALKVLNANMPIGKGYCFFDCEEVFEFLFMKVEQDYKKPEFIDSKARKMMKRIKKKPLKRKGRTPGQLLKEARKIVVTELPLFKQNAKDVFIHKRKLDSNYP